MSAIWGCINLKKEPVSQEIFERMKAPFSACRIDKYTGQTGGWFAMGAGIQYFVPEAAQEEFPITLNKGYLTADCLLDNRSELCKKLDMQEENLCDGRLLAGAFEKWGIDCLKYLRGLFSFAVCLKEEDVCYLAVDQMANRCLYYCIEEDILYFSTLIEPIKQVKKSVRWNRSYIGETLAIPGLRLQMSVDSTPYEEIYKVPAGTYLFIKKGEVKKVSYWNPGEFIKKTELRSAEEYGKRCREVIEQSVADAMRTMGKVGIALSSGLDSATVGGIAAENLKKREQQLYSYTYVPLSDYQEEDKLAIANEAGGVALLAKMHGNIKMHFMENADCNAINQMEKMISVLEMPYKAVQNIPQLLSLYEQAKEDGCLVVLNGHYGNVTFSYGSHLNAIYDSLIHGKLKKAYGQFVDFCNVNKVRKKQYGFYVIKSFLGEPFRCLKEKLLKRDVKKSLVNLQFAKEHKLQKQITEGGFGAGTCQYTSLRQHRQRLYDKGDLVYLGEIATKMSLVTGVLIRDPFADVRVMELCAAMPMDVFVHKGVERWLIRGNMQKYVPISILQNYRYRGKQSADWMYRLQKQADETVETLKKECFHPVLSSFISKGKVEEFFEELNGTFRNELFTETNSILYLASLSCFLQANPEK